MSSESQAVPRKLLNYTLQHELGHGGMASVWYAENSVGRPFAIKVLKPGLLLQEPSIAERFRNEAQIMVRLDHPHIRRVEDYYEDGQTMAIIMEYLDGEDLHHHTRGRGPIPEKEAIDWFGQVLDAFTYVHEQGYFHRDVKPSNLFLTRKGQIKVVDFGIAKIVGTDLSLTHTDTLMGSPLYMSPEQIQTPKQIDFRTDIYSLGVTLYTLLSGAKPYDDAKLSAFGVQSAIVHNVLSPLPSVSVTTNQAIQKATQKDPSQRFRDCEAFAKSLTTSTFSSDEATVLQPRPTTSDEATLLQSKATPSGRTLANRAASEPEEKTVMLPKVNAPQTISQPSKPINTTSIPNTISEKKRQTRPILLAALVGSLLLSAGGYWFWFRPNTETAKPKSGSLVSTDSLNKDASRTDPTGQTPTGNNSKTAEQKGIAFYKKARYDSAFAVLNQIQQTLGLADTEAMTDLGVMHYYGEGTARDANQAEQWFTKANTPKAKYFLGLLKDGITDPNTGESRGISAQAIDLYRESAAGGDAYGQATIGRLFLLENNYLKNENPCTVLGYLNRAKMAGVAGAANNYRILQKRSQCP